MTSFTKALFKHNPNAFRDLRKQRQTDQLVYGKHITLACFTPKGFTPAFPTSASVVRGGEKAKTFGQRNPRADRAACADDCGNPACSNGCVLINR